MSARSRQPFRPARKASKRYPGTDLLGVTTGPEAYRRPDGIAVVPASVIDV